MLLCVDINSNDHFDNIWGNCIAKDSHDRLAIMRRIEWKYLYQKSTLYKAENNFMIHIQKRSVGGRWVHEEQN